MIRMSGTTTAPKRFAVAAVLSACSALLVYVQPAHAGNDAAPGAAELAETAEAPALEPTARSVGEATRALLALQRSGDAASPVPRPLPGAVATRSQQRYLKSFEYEIPERFQSSVAVRPSGR